MAIVLGEQPLRGGATLPQSGTGVPPVKSRARGACQLKRLIEQFAENQHVAVRILHFEFPVAVRLSSKRQNDLNLVL